MSVLIGSILGWIGTVGTFSAYLLLMRGHLAAETLRYSLLNAVGGMLAAGGAYAFGAWPAFVSNILWAGIGVHGIVLALRKRRANRGTPTLQLPIEPRLGPDTGLIPQIR